MFGNSTIAVPPDETIVWSGTPGRRLVLGWRDAYNLVIGTVFFCVGLTALSSLLRSHVTAATVLFPIPFILIGLYTAIGRPAIVAYRLSRTRYAVTDRAAYLETGLDGSSLLRLSGSELDDVRLAKKPNGSGTLWFGTQTTRLGALAPPSPLRAFFSIRDVDAAYAAVLAARPSGS